MNNNYQEIIDDLLWVIDTSTNEFSLKFVRCNYPQLRAQIMTEINHNCENQITELILDQYAIDLYHEISKFVQDQEMHCLVISGLENVRNIDQLLGSTNLQRERFRSDFHFTIIIWLDDVILNKFTILAKDFQAWGGIALRYNITLEDLINNSQYIIDKLFNQIMEIGSRDFPSNESILGQSYQIEYNSIKHDFQQLGADLPLTLQGVIAFTQGRNLFSQNKFKEAISSYENSVNYWQNLPDISPLNQAVLQYHLGLAYYSLFYQQNRPDDLQLLQLAKNHLERGLNIFEQQKQLDLLAKFINSLGEVLRRLNDWENLKILAEKCQTLNQHNPLFLAASYGFLCEVCLARSLHQEAINWIELAVDEEKSGIYLLLLALCEETTNHHQKAMEYAEQAIKLDVNKQQRFYFLDLLEKLDNLYFQKKQYLAAYQTKLNIQSLKQQYSLIAFVGAGRIKASKNETTNLCQEIESSGRKYDVNELVNRLSSINKRMTIIYGQSGVGKSSILEAGLIPALLQKKYIDNKEILTINLRVYHSWKQELGTLLKTSPLVHVPQGEGDETVSLDGLITILKDNDQNNIMTMLFFDQFEEFFFVNQSPSAINEFFRFVAECLKIVYVKIIFSLREDYLYLLLKGTRHFNLDAINNDILSKDILYYLGNLSVQVTTDLITNLTHRSDFNLEPELITELVTDLTTELDDIRPIELQIIGSQLQTESITTLKQYNQLGAGKARKEKLVNNYLAVVINACGDNNIELAKFVLSLLINEKDNTRPLKTKLEIAESLTILKIPQEAQQLDLVLQIFVLSGLVILLPEKPTDRYQLVHDYLVEVIRQQMDQSLLSRLRQAEEEREQEKIAKLRWLKGLRVAVFFLIIVSGFATKFAIDSNQAKLESQNQEIKALSNSANAYYLVNRQSLDSLLEALKAGKKLQQSLKQTPLETQGLTKEILNKSVYNPQNDIKNFREKNRLSSHQGEVISVAFSPDGQTLASASWDNTIKLWGKDGKLLQTLSGHQGWVYSVAFSPDGQTLASASGDKTIKLWGKDGKLLQTLSGHQGEVYGVAFSPDGQTLASASWDNTIKLWGKDGKLL
ncbi:MAG: hypothetical protein ACKO11_15875, partial [Cuspidothrix sp.]